MSELRGGSSLETAVRRFGLKDDDAIGFWKRRGLEKHRVHEGEDRGVGSNSEAEGEYCGEGEGTTALPEHADGMAKITQEGFHEKPFRLDAVFWRKVPLRSSLLPDYDLAAAANSGAARRRRPLSR